MKNRLDIRFLIVVISFIPLIASGQNSSGTEPIVRLGVSQINITPEKPILMSGYAARTTPFTKVHDDLYASALFFSGEKNKSLLITADLIGFSNSFIEDIKKTISSKIDIPEENIMISAVHTHGGPNTRTYENDTSDAVNDYIKTLKEKLTTLALEASKNTVPFRMGIGKGSCNMNINRRAEFADGIVFLGKDPNKPCDHELDVVKFEDMNNKILAVLINWPCHGTAGGQENYQITGDWPGAAARSIKKQLGNNIVVPVTVGASADICPIYDRVTNFKEIEAVGYHVGREALKTLSQINTLPFNSTVQVKNEIITFPGKKGGADNLPPTSFERGPDVAIQLTTFKIGSLVLAGISGEVMTEIGMEVKKQSPYTATLVVTHCNGSSGYICTDKSFSEGGYEIRTTKLMPGAEKLLTMKVLGIINSF